ncbi:hypothetical protein EV401DRAFT_1882471 [Pisolithus croceorrhizus]|nr:hypothetical protein EV401DRAFT_1882471 [Pisolithus croceorrhizus]
MSTTAEEELQVLYGDLRQIHIVNYVTLSCMAFLVHDILTNLDDEIPLIWRYYNNDEHISWRRRARRILVQTLFIFGRYFAPLCLVGMFAVNNHQGFSIPFCKCSPFHSESCKVYYYLIIGGELLYSMLVNTILVRDYGSIKSSLHLWSPANIIICATTATWMETRVVEPPAGFPWPGLILLGLTLRLLYLSIKLKFRSFGDITIHNIKEEIRNIRPVTLTLVRDSVLFYFPMFGILVASVPVMALYHTNLANVTIPIIIALYSFCASRLIIHTRENFTRSSREVPSRGVDPIDFAPCSSTVSHVGTHVCYGETLKTGRDVRHKEQPHTARFGSSSLICAQLWLGAFGARHQVVVCTPQGQVLARHDVKFE